MEWTPPFPRRHDAPGSKRTRCALNADNPLTAYFAPCRIVVWRVELAELESARLDRDNKMSGYQGGDNWLMGILRAIDGYMVTVPN